MAEQRRVALVTGAAQGIGLAIADRLLQAGMHVILADVQWAEVEAAAARASAAHDHATPLQIDVSDEAAVTAAFAWLDEKFGRLDVLVNNAGISLRVNGVNARVEATPLDIWSRTLAVNLTGTFLMCRAAAPRMSANGWGRIVNMTSIAARSRGEVASGYYAASKGGVVAFSRILAAELGPSGVTVNCISPSRIVSPLTRNYTGTAELDQRYIDKTPMKRLGQPPDVAAAAAYLCSDEAGFVTGTILDVTGGYFMP